ncbi:hypothetical protein GWI72_07400 [Microvirga tunisiensis]|uniref:Bacterial transcriptional activator domain-containing protein n=1 Tax=Pannonibacter tanglangensis TaxID=2750084 RepID=A0A7X5J998_9HYPH|nr:BTAD domain-containing putative transcriptional regulator [Pannonibacter sp. XCT-53]NBN78090.1 hypothetical protein [Pannonibacter sp. XCT-53]
MAERLHLQTLGLVRLATADGETLALKTRKALALLAYLLRRPGLSATRSDIAALLWSEGERAKAAVSLRQAVAHVRQTEALAGLRLIETTPTSITLCAEVLTTDLDEIQQMLGGFRPLDSTRLKALWGGDFLNGFDTLDPAFADWLALEQERVRASVIEKTVSALEDLQILGGAAAVNQREVLAGFLLGLDPAHEFAHQTLIRHYLAQGRRERALQQYRDCARELRNLLDQDPDPATLLLIEDAGAGDPARRPPVGAAGTAQGAPAPGAAPGAVLAPAPVAAPTGGGMASATVDLAGLRRDISLPVLSIASLSFEREADHLALSLRDEIVAGLSAYRCFELYEAAYWIGEDGAAPMRVEGGELGSFLLRFRRDRMLNRIYVQLENRSSGQIAFNEVIDLELTTSASDRVEAVFRTVSRVHSHVIGRLRMRPGRTAFSRWCQAEALMWEFNRAADQKALQILAELEQSHPSYSQIYAGRCSIQMKQALFYPTVGGGLLDTEATMTLAEKAVALDPWQVINHRMLGWSMIHAARPDDAHRAFSQALSLNPMDPMNVISAAEALAYIGDLRKATDMAMKAFDGLTTTPRIVYGYLANIFFASGDFDRAAEFARRGPMDNIHGLATRLAALDRAGFAEDAAATRDILLQRIETQFGRGRLKPVPLELRAWLDQVNMFQEPATRAAFERGLDSVREALGLGRA